MKNSKPNSSPKNPHQPSPQGMDPITNQLTLQMLHALQLERLIWLMAREAAGAVVVDEASLNPLWDASYERVKMEDGKDHPTLLKITANALPEPSDTQIRKLAELLNGQPEEATPAALMQCGMSGFPPGYVTARLAPLVVCKDGKWGSV